jgi:carbon-monoxide dehydrogenase large subunit
MQKFGIGQAVRRVEDARFLTGEGAFVDDIELPRLCHAVVLMSPHAHALIRSVDISAATAVEGVVCVLTGADALADGLGGIGPMFMPEDAGGPKGYRTVRPILVADRVRCVGDRIAFVVAETLAAAREAAELIVVDYEPLPAVIGVEDSVAEGAPLVWDDCPGNTSFTLRFGDAGRTDAAFAGAAHIVALDLVNNRLSANSIEPRGAVGQYHPAEGSYTLHVSAQNPHGTRTVLAAEVFGIPESRIRVVTPDVGGGFGLKSPCYPEDALVLWAARRCRRPVKWIPTRAESLVGDNHARDQLVHGEMALDAEGRILGIRARTLHAFGAYTMGSAVAPMTFSLRFIPSVYSVGAVDLSCRAVFTNTAPLTSYRGAGRPEAAYVTERLLDVAADRIGLDRDEIRRRNMIRPEALPYATRTGFVYDSGSFAATLERARALADWDGFDARRRASEARGLRRGRGIAYFIEQGGIFNDRMELRFDPGGNVTIVAGTHSHGQGHATVFAQLVSEWLGLPFEQIGFVQGDTEKVSFGRGTYAARSSLLGGSALKLAADAIVEKARAMAAHLFETAIDDVAFEDGTFRVAGTDRTLAMTDVAQAFFRRGGIPAEFGLGLEASATWDADPPNFPNGCHVCEAEVDPDTGAVALLIYAAVDDIGRVLNPMICEGQIHGGVAQGLGQALMEHAAYDPDSGQLLAGSFMDYAMPRAEDLGDFRLAFAEIPCTTNPLGVKGIGEAGTIGAPPALIGAILDALKPLGVRHIDMPATPARVWDAIRSAAEARA